MAEEIPTTTTTQGAPWYQGIAGVDSEMIGHWTNRGWHTKPAAEVAVEATKSWREAEKHLGVPKDEIVRLGKNPTPEQLDGLYTRLGRPAEAKAYDFSAVKFKDGTPLDEPFSEHVRGLAFKFGLSASAGTELAQQLVAFAENADAGETAGTAAALLADKQALEKNWGANFTANKVIAQNAARALGVAPETVSALESVVGYSKVMDMFLQIGQKIGEDAFVSNSRQGGGNGVMSRDQAMARKSELKADSAWVTKFLAGDVTAKREMESLDRLIVG